MSWTFSIVLRFPDLRAGNNLSFPEASRAYCSGCKIEHRNLEPQRGILSRPLDVLQCVAIPRAIPPHPFPLPRGEGIASEDSRCSTPLRETPRSDFPKTGEWSTLSLGERAGVRGNKL